MRHNQRFLRFVRVVLLLLVFCSERSTPCDVIGATGCQHKPDAELKNESLESYCATYKTHLECVYAKYKGCDKRPKYADAMESMMRGLRRKAAEVEEACEDVEIAIPSEEDELAAAEAAEEAAAAKKNKKGGKNNKNNKSSGNYLRRNGLTRETTTTSTQLPCRIGSIASDCHLILSNVQFNPSAWSGVVKQRWCNSAGPYHACIRTRLHNCVPGKSAFIESLGYYEKIQQYVQTQANIYCPGGLEGCAVNAHDVRCKMGVRYNQLESAAVSSVLVDRFFSFGRFIFTSIFFYLLSLFLLSS